MRLLGSLLAVLTVTALTLAQQNTTWPIRDDGLNEVVQWDRYSLIVNGERFFLWSGEFHPFRIPVPELWPDIIQKIKAAGFNSVSIHLHWGWHQAADDPSAVDFHTGSHDIRSIFELAKGLGLWVIMRPGPYINAESTGGGFPGCLLTGAYGSLRNNDSRYTEAWTPYMTQISEIVSEYSVTNGGNIILYQIENEYGNQWEDPAERTPNNTAIDYMSLLENTVVDAGVDIPTIANNGNFYTKSWSTDYDVDNVGGNTDLYNLDHYPGCWSCNLDTCASVNGFPPEFSTFDYYTNFQETAPSQPSILGEFQGGSYNPWGGPADGCRQNTGPEWANVYYRHNVGQKVSGVNVYMLFGGTNWGGLPFPEAITSYDYSAGISESRLLWDKYSEMKLLGYFFRAAKGLTRVELQGNGTTNYTTNNDNVFAAGMVNMDDGSMFYLVEHANTSLTTREEFKLNMSTSVGHIQAPQYAADVVLDGHQAKLLVTDFAAGDQHLIYSTSEILAVSAHESTIIVFWVPAGESGEFYLRGAQSAKAVKCEGCSNVQFHGAEHGLIIAFTQSEGMTVLEFDNGARAVIVDRTVGYAMWQPVLSNDPMVQLDQTLLVRGPELVRDARMEGGMVIITGDYDGETDLEVFAPSCDSSTIVTFNGAAVDVSLTAYGSVVGHLSAGTSSLSDIEALLPALDEWKVAQGLPEKEPSYRAMAPAWVVADNGSTPNPWKPETYPVLYADAYGFHAQNILWRAQFPVFGGTAAGFTVWLNGHFIGSAIGTAYPGDKISNATLAFNGNEVSGDNVLLVLQDHTGHQQTVKALDPRGVLNATLIAAGGSSEDAGNFSSWHVAGKAGGQANIDPIRGPYNEGGLTAERLGWHLPGFDDSDWDSGSPTRGFEGADVMFYRTVADLDLPTGYDYNLAFDLEAPADAELRAQLYVNGYMFGKFIPHIGNQASFPVFPGILDYHGPNTIGLSVWAQSSAGARMGVRMSVLGMYESGLNASVGTEYLRPGWSEERLQYA